MPLKPRVEETLSEDSPGKVWLSDRTKAILRDWMRSCMLLASIRVMQMQGGDDIWKSEEGVLEGKN
jgi:hypothetical protein